MFLKLYFLVLLESPLIMDFLEFVGKLNLEEFFLLAFEVERFFKHRDILERK